MRHKKAATGKRRTRIENRIGAIVDERGWTITRFAEEADIAYMTASDLYSGSAKRIGFDIMERVCDALDRDPGDLFVRVPVEQSSVAVESGPQP